MTKIHKFIINDIDHPLSYIEVYKTGPDKTSLCMLKFYEGYPAHKIYIQYVYRSVFNEEELLELYQELKGDEEEIKR